MRIGDEVKEVKLSEREILSVLEYFGGPQTWGGPTPEVMLLKADLRDILGLKALDTKVQAIRHGVSVDAGKLSEELVSFELSDELVTLLREILGRGNQDNKLAALSVEALRRMR